ncbi:MAG: pantoate--beta-alanine ligase [Sandaracinaceae bacterium]
MSGAVVIERPRELRERCDAVRACGARVGFVPTMGALHRGHLSLIDAARAAGADHIVVSIFVNPTQFGPNEDLARYPRTFEADKAACDAAGVDTIFAPSPDAMYPDGFSTTVRVAGVTEPLEGVHRPGHFDGVTTVVAKLFAAVGPSLAAFGRKDYQQLATVRRMTRDLDLPVEIVAAPIVREEDGLALSSRNRYLDADARARALGIVTGLREAYDRYAAGVRDGSRLVTAARAPIEARFDRIDYVALADADDLAPLDRVGESGRAVLAVAAHVSGTRLIDNVVLGEDPRP